MVKSQGTTLFKLCTFFCSKQKSLASKTCLKLIESAGSTVAHFSIHWVLVDNIPWQSQLPPGPRVMHGIADSLEEIRIPMPCAFHDVSCFMRSLCNCISEHHHYHCTDYSQHADNLGHFLFGECHVESLSALQQNFRSTMVRVHLFSQVAIWPGIEHPKKNISVGVECRNYSKLIVHMSTLWVSPRCAFHGVLDADLRSKVKLETWITCQVWIE